MDYYRISQTSCPLSDLIKLNKDFNPVKYVLNLSPQI